MSMESDKDWSDKFIPIICQIVGPKLLVPSPLVIDRNYVADLVVLKGKDTTIGCRVRKHRYLKQYGGEFTMRHERDSGAKTEMAKIEEGWGDWMFYGFSNEEETTFAQWVLLDLDAWRHHWAKNRSRIIWNVKPNGDGTHLAWFNIKSFIDIGEPNLVVDTSVIDGVMA